MRRGHGKCNPPRKTIRISDRRKEQSQKELQKLIKEKVTQGTDQSNPV